MACNKHFAATSHRVRRARPLRKLAALLLIALLAACSGPARSAAPPLDELVVVAMVAPLADLAGQVVGDRGVVHPLVPAGVDAHTYEPTPSNVRLLERTDLFVANGLHLNDGLVRLAETNMPDGGKVIRLAERTLAPDAVAYDESADGGGARLPNPHVWMNVRYAAAYVSHISDALADIEPAHADDYRRSAQRYQKVLDALDQAILTAARTIPAAHRKLVTYHDSWAYFAPRYGLELVAAVQPADFAEPSPAEVRRVIDGIRAADVPAVFGSEGFPSDVLDAISRETGVRYVADLSDDVLPGEPGTPEHSYVGMMLRNASTIVTALGGDDAALQPVAEQAGITTPLAESGAPS